MSGMSSPESSSLSSAPTDSTRYYISTANARARLRSYRPEGNDDKTVTLLEAFVEFLPREGACNIMDDIVQCESDEKLRQLAGNLNTAVLLPMLARGPTPVVILSPRFNALQDLEEIASEFDGVSSRNEQSWLKIACLQRDGGRCVVSGYYDSHEAEKLSTSEKASVTTSGTQAAHIVPFSLGASVVRFFNWESKELSLITC
ncbi:MAG: hypothetical protein Q9217_004290 [Psora testacea]